MPITDLKQNVASRNLCMNNICTQLSNHAKHANKHKAFCKERALTGQKRDRVVDLYSMFAAHIPRGCCLISFCTGMIYKASMTVHMMWNSSRQRCTGSAAKSIFFAFGMIWLCSLACKIHSRLRKHVLMLKQNGMYSAKAVVSGVHQNSTSHFTNSGSSICHCNHISG